MKKLLFTTLLLATILGGCCCNRTVALNDTILAHDASAWPLHPDKGYVFTDNDSAFLNKITMIRGAKRSIDLSYYIFSDDESSSLLTRELIVASNRGVKIRLLVDYETNYSNLDLYSMIEHEGKGNIQVRLYNRPTANIVKDAVFMTMGCSKEKAASQAPTACSNEKYAAIDKLFADEKIKVITTGEDGAEKVEIRPAADFHVSNLNSGNSGLFLSGLYAKDGGTVASAIENGGGVDLEKLKSGAGGPMTPERKEQLKKLARLFWESKKGNDFQKLTSDIELFFIFGLYGKQLDPLKEMVTSILPVDRSMGPDDLKDWDHYTDYTHHKLLLVDGAEVQMGGRNVENFYHMNPNPLLPEKKNFVFMDTDIYASVAPTGQLVTAFNNLWNFIPMVARIDEVRQHAPNDYIVTMNYAKQACETLEKQYKACVAEQPKSEAQVKQNQVKECAPKNTEYEACVQKQQQTVDHELPSRMEERRKAMEANAARYESSYKPIQVPLTTGFPLDGTSVLAYLENLPFDKNLPPEQRQRTYGALAGKESEAGKNIHDVWLGEIPRVCSAATASNPGRIVLHNAYFYPSANLAKALSSMVDGTYDCSNVTITVLTNSIETTDLNVVNMVAHQTIKAFDEFYDKKSDPKKRARFEYLEYRKRIEEGYFRSLHTKVSVFGDDIIIGSANADVRSFMMDSNNAMLVRNAPELLKSCLAFVDQIISQPGLVNNMNEYFRGTTHQDIKARDEASIFEYLDKKYAYYSEQAEKRKDEEKRQASDLMDDAYKQMTDVLNSCGGKSKAAQDKFDEAFKPI